MAVTDFLSTYSEAITAIFLFFGPILVSVFAWFVNRLVKTIDELEERVDKVEVNLAKAWMRLRENNGYGDCWK